VNNRRWLRPWVVVLALALVYVVLTLVRYDGDPMMFVLPGTRYSQGDPEGTSGYDGQFAYFIARDPLNGWRYCDAPSYRYQRILYPILAWVLALGRPGVVPWTLIVINVAALAGGTYFTERLLAAHHVSRWYALAYGLYGGLIAGLRLDLTEPLAYGLVQAGLWAWERRRVGEQEGKRVEGQHAIHNTEYVLLALAALAKETALLAMCGLLLYLALARRWRQVLTMGLAVVLPFAIWQVVLRVWLGEWGIGSGGDMATPFEVIPFAGLARVAATSLPAFRLLLAIEGPLFVLPTVWALYTSARDLARGLVHPWVTVLLVQAAALPFLPFSTWREPLAMARLAAGLISATLLYGALRRSQRVLNYSVLWLATLALLVNESALPI